MPPTSVQISAVTVGPLKETSDYLDTVKSRKSVTLLPNIDGHESDLATTQATLASLQSTLRSKQANVDYTETQYARYQNLLNEGAVSQAELDGWKNNYTAAQADRDAAMQQILATIKNTN